MTGVDKSAGDGAIADDPNAAPARDPNFAIFDRLSAHVQSTILERRSHNKQPAVYVRRENAYALLEELKTVSELLLVDVTAVDYLNKDLLERFVVVYVLQDRQNSRYGRVHAWVPEADPSIRSVSSLWALAGWGERECYDMFGIVFEGNPDLRRMLMPEDYPGFPLLKDYPLKGRGERVQFPRVVPAGGEMVTTAPLPYPVTIGRGLHTPEYQEEMKRDSEPRP
ncbi:MAG: NADH-quinone oxidoreductase subunit C [Planctomycetota bacterium]